MQEVLNEKQLSVSEAAKICGIVRPQFSAYVSGTRLPTVTLLKKICESLHVSADYLLALVDDNQNNELELITKKLTQEERRLLASITKAILDNRK